MREQVGNPPRGSNERMQHGPGGHVRPVTGLMLIRPSLHIPSAEDTLSPQTCGCAKGRVLLNQGPPFRWPSGNR